MKKEIQRMILKVNQIDKDKWEVQGTLDIDGYIKTSLELTTRQQIDVGHIVAAFNHLFHYIDQGKVRYRYGTQALHEFEKAWNGASVETRKLINELFFVTEEDIRELVYGFSYV